MPKDRLTVFMFGYDGWGNATKELRRATSKVEDLRGYNPPYWVDTRHNPHTRALGFYGEAFKKLVGDDNYCAIPELGNANIGLDATSDRIRIESPRAAEKLLTIVKACRRKNQRVIFFCQCPVPRKCHRHKIATLLVRAAKKKGISLDVIEWPGDELDETKLSIRAPRSALRKSNLHLERAPSPLGKFAALPAGSLLRVHDGKGWEKTVAVKAVRFTKGSWQFPLVKFRDRTTTNKAQVAAWRKTHGYTPLTTRTRRRAASGTHSLDKK